MFKIVKQINKLQFLREARLAEFLQSRHLYLPYSFSRETKVCGDFRESAVGVHTDTEPHADYLCFTCSQCFHTIMTCGEGGLFPVCLYRYGICIERDSRSGRRVGGEWECVVVLDFLGRTGGRHIPHTRDTCRQEQTTLSLCAQTHTLFRCVYLVRYSIWLFIL